MARNHPPHVPSFLPHPDRPLTRRQQDEFHAIRIALLLFVAVDKIDLFTSEYHILSNSRLDLPLDWIRAKLAPLENGSPTIKEIRRVTDQRHFHRAWDDSAGLRATLNRLLADIRIEARRSKARQARHG